MKPARVLRMDSSVRSQLRAVLSSRPKLYSSASWFMCRFRSRFACSRRRWESARSAPARVRSSWSRLWCCLRRWLADSGVRMCVTSYEAVPAECTGLRRMREKFRRSYYGYMSSLNEAVDPVDVQATLLEFTAISLADAVKRGASDVHFEPEAAFLRVRYRIDGVLEPMRSLHRKYWPAVAVRLKVISGLNIAESRRVGEETDKFERRQILVFKEDLPAFLEGLEKAVGFMRRR
ncbi:Flp pilus assembly complex ATPase component TadA [bacterium]|nr:Flp pilus assembly complex ATPase component TadA [bacterium]